MSSQEQGSDVDVGESHLLDDLRDAHEGVDCVYAVIGAGTGAGWSWGGQAGHGGGGAPDAEGAKAKITDMANPW